MQLQDAFSKCGALIRRCVTSRSVVALLLLIAASVAHAQTQTVSVTGGGSLSFLVTQRLDFICSTPSFYIREYDYTNFVYTDTSGTRYPMSGTAYAYQVTGDNRDNCPTPPPSNPIQLSSQGYTVSFVPSNGFGSASLGPIPLFLTPKYLVLAVTYAPPGSASYVNYSNSTAQGTSTNLSNTFTNATNVSVTATTGASLGIFSAQSSITASADYTYEKDSSSSIALNQTTSYGRQIPGPSSSAQGVNHAYDVIWVWLNPVANLSINPDGSLSWRGYSYDASDVNEMDIVPLYVSWLQNPSTIPASVQTALARNWDTSGTGALTPADYSVILTRDPMLNSSFNPNTDTSHRFDLEGGTVFNYEPPPAGGQPITETYSLAYQTTTTQGQGASDTYSVGLSIDAKFNASIAIAKASLDVKVSNTSTWVNKWSTLNTGTVGQTASLSITGPATTDNYTGPTRFQVFKDNVYGTFLFYPAN
jgi:hypothetical protein